MTSAARRFLVVQLADIGDLVLSTPALVALCQAHPASHIAVLTTAHAAPILDQTGLANEIITFDKHTFDHPKALLTPNNLKGALMLAARLRRGNYDTALIFHHFSTRFGALKFAGLVWSAGSKRIIGLDNGNGFFLTERLVDEGFGARHQAQYWLDLVACAGAEASAHSAVVGISQADRLWAAGKLGNTADGLSVSPSPPIIAIHPGSGGYSLARRWDAAHFASVADALIEQHVARIVIVGSKQDGGDAVMAAMKYPALDLSGQTTLGQLAAVLERCALYLGADSGVMHIAAAVGIPVVAIFGPSNHTAFRPWSPNGRALVVRSAPLCSPCSYVGTGVGLREGCAARTCIRMVTPEQILAAADTLLNNRSDTDIPVELTAELTAKKRLHILDIPVDCVTYDDWLARINEWVQSNARCRQVCTVNPEFLMIARQDVNFRNILQRADLCVPDGIGLLWAARRRGIRLPERVTGSDGVPKIAQAAAKNGWRLFLLGAAPGVADKAADVLRSRYPGVEIVGTYGGSPASEDEDAIVERVNASGADILFVAYGAPEQDKWIARNLPRLKPKMAMGIGGSLDFVAGIVPRAPLWMQRAGLEWLFRLYLQPRRIGRMMRLPRFVVAVLLEEIQAKALKRGE